jgi:hypothetical protein
MLTELLILIDKLSFSKQSNSSQNIHKEAFQVVIKYINESLITLIYEVIYLTVK